MGVGDVFKLYIYEGDDGNNYIVKLSSVVAAAGGFSGPVSQVGTNRVWPYKSRNLRHVYGENGSGKRDKCPIGTAANALFVSGGSFTTNAGNFTVSGWSGERRPRSFIGG